MSQQTRAILKTYFETGDRPTQQQFIDLIDSLINIIDDGIQPLANVVLPYTSWQPNAGASGTINAILVPAGYQVDRIYIIPTTRFSGGTISAVSLDLYDPQDLNMFVNSRTDLHTAIDNYTGNACPGYVNTDRRLNNKVANSYVRAKITVTGGVINNLIQGSLTLYYLLNKLT